ncbi:MAG: hypothetical protein JRJ54_06785 [Deltaproteobacteria bacterium]|nr:hypothetical protein [Deltaproteobacteria bacterium]
MGKNSLVKSTTKKKTATKKKSASPKAKDTAKSAPAKTRPAKGTGKPKAGSAKIKKQQAPSLKTLLFKKFDTWQPEKPFVPKGTKQPRAFTAPPFFTGKSEAESKKLRALLFKKFDLAGAPSVPVEEAPATKPPPVSPTPAPEPPTPAEPAKPVVEAEPVTEPVAAKGKEETVKTDAPPAPGAPEPEKKSPEPEITGYQPPAPPKEADPMERAMKFCIAGFALLVLILIAVSASNANRYAVTSSNGGIEIWKGNFAPIGQKRILVLPGVQPSKPLKSQYTKEEAFTLAFDYYLQKADGLLEVSGMPDFEGIRRSLTTAASYAVAENQRTQVNNRLTHLDLMLLLYKAEVALGKGTLEGVETAMGHLKAAGALQLDKNQRAMVNTRMEAAQKKASELKAKAPVKPPAPTGTPPQAAGKKAEKSPPETP